MHELYILVGASGTGKTTLRDIALGIHPNSAYLPYKIPNLQRIVTCTTRQRREGEREGVEYHFRTLDEFNYLWATGELLERAKPNDHHYGVLKSAIDTVLVQSDGIVIVEGEGVPSVLNAYPTSSLLYIEPIALRLAEERMRARGDKQSTINQRVSFFQKEVVKLQKAVRTSSVSAYMIKNTGTIEAAAEQFKNTIELIREQQRSK